jgi:transposase
MKRIKNNIRIKIDDNEFSSYSSAAEYILDKYKPQGSVLSGIVYWIRWQYYEAARNRFYPRCKEKCLVEFLSKPPVEEVEEWMEAPIC